MVMGKRYQLNDTNISIIGRAVKQPVSNVKQVQQFDEDGEPIEGINNAVLPDDNILEGEEDIEYEDGEDEYSEEEAPEDEDELEDLGDEEFDDMDGGESFGGFSDGEY